MESNQGNSFNSLQWHAWARRTPTCNFHFFRCYLEVLQNMDKVLHWHSKCPSFDLRCQGLWASSMSSLFSAWSLHLGILCPCNYYIISPCHQCHAATFLHHIQKQLKENKGMVLVDSFREVPRKISYTQMSICSLSHLFCQLRQLSTGAS